MHLKKNMVRIYQDVYEDFYIEDIKYYNNQKFQQSYKIGNEEDVKYKDIENIVDLLNEQEERVKELESCNHSLAQKDLRKFTKIIELEKENEKLKQKIKEETDRVIKLEQYVYTKLCPKSEHYDEKVLSEIINTILTGDVDD